MNAAALTEQLQAASRQLANDATFAQRQQALHRFDELGLPGRAIETWRYTDLAPLADKPLEFIAELPDQSLLADIEARLAELESDPNAARYVLVDGRLIESLSRPCADSGLEIGIGSLAESSPDDPALVALNSAFASQPVTIRAETSVATPLTVLFVSSGRPLASQARLRIELAAGATLNLQQDFVDLTSSDESWLNLVVDIDQAESSRLELCRLQQTGSARYQTTLTRARLEAGAKLIAGNFELGGTLIRNEYEIALNGRQAEADVYGLALTRDRQHCDTRIAVDHAAPDTRSLQEYRTIAGDRSRSVFNGKVTVRQDAQHIEARQRNDNLLLSAQAEIDTKPELEIYADQVVCSHGATVGELSEDQLFYLRARGIDARTARAILTSAFAAKIIERLEQADLRQHIAAAVEQLLPQDDEPE